MLLSSTAATAESTRFFDFTPLASSAGPTESGGATSPYARLFELKNPLTATGIVDPLMPDSNDNAVFVHQNVVPRTLHEGIQFDTAGNMYFIDELNGVGLYKYTPDAKMSKVKNGQADYFAAGRTFVLPSDKASKSKIAPCVDDSAGSVAARSDLLVGPCSLTSRA